MLHLARVQRSESSTGPLLQLLAYQKPDQTWTLMDKRLIPLPTAGLQPEGAGQLVLVEISESETVITMTDATDWVLTLVDHFLTLNITPEFLRQEVNRAEKWRQSLTLESQDLGRRYLELEARHEQLQTLEASLKEEKQQLETLARRLKLTMQSEGS